MIGIERSKNASTSGAANASLWQHPYVDVFKHFKIMPTSDWKANKKQGDVQEIFVNFIHYETYNFNRLKKSVEKL